MTLIKSTTLRFGLMAALLFFSQVPGPASAQVSIPQGAIVDEARLGLYVISLPPSAQPIRLYRMSAGWNELEVTWLNATSSIAWGLAGGDYVVPAFQTFTPVAGWQEIDITAIVQEWVNGSAPNFGILLEQDLAGTRFGSSEGTHDPTMLQPALLITYHTVSDPAPVTVRLARSINGSDVADATISSQLPSSNEGALLQLVTGAASPDVFKRALLRFGFDLTPAPVPLTGSIGQRVWDDADQDGVQDDDESGISGVAVVINNSQGNVLDAQITGRDGSYTFAGLPEGVYGVCVDIATLPAGFSQTYDLDGLSTPNCAAASLLAGESRTGVDFGYWQPAALGDWVWHDTNGNGIPDSGEVGLNGIAVILRDSKGNTLGAQTTVEGGSYTFANLPAGAYQVCIDAATLPVGFRPTDDLDGLSTPNCASVYLIAGESRSDVDFGYWRPTSLGDRVWHDTNGNGVPDTGEAGFHGITLVLKDSQRHTLGTTTTIGAQGRYSFGGLPAGAYQVCVITATLPAGFSQTYDRDGLSTANCATAVLAAGQNHSDVDFGFWQAPGSCSYTLAYWMAHSKYGPASYNPNWAKVGEDTRFFSTQTSWYEAIRLPVNEGDAFSILARQYVAAYLNQKAGVSISSISSTMTHAQYLLDRYDGNPYPASSITEAVRSDFIAAAATLDRFNSGLIGPGHCQ